MFYRIPESERSTQAATLFDRPWHKDWIVRLWAMIAFLQVGNTSKAYAQDHLTWAGQTAYLLDVAFDIGIVFLLFGVIPAAIRRAGRLRRTAEKSAA